MISLGLTEINDFYRKSLLICTSEKYSGQKDINAFFFFTLSVTDPMSGNTRFKLGVGKR
jgi:hypothetical protein